MPPTELSVGRLAVRSGVAVSALHFYERQGLISSTRTSGNQRRYRRDMLRRVALIRIAVRVGIPLADVSSVLALLPEGRTPTRRDWERISQCWRAASVPHGIDGSGRERGHPRRAHRARPLTSACC